LDGGGSLKRADFTLTIPFSIYITPGKLTQRITKVVFTNKSAESI